MFKKLQTEFHIIKAITDNEKINILNISFMIKRTYSFVYKTIMELKNEGYIIFKRNGRELIPILTEKGLKISNIVNKLFNEAYNENDIPNYKYVKNLKKLNKINEETLE